MGETVQVSSIAGALRQVLSGTAAASRWSPSRRPKTPTHKHSESERGRRWIAIQSMIEHGVLPKLLGTHLRESAVDTRPMALDQDTQYDRGLTLPMETGAKTLAKHAAFGQTNRASGLVARFRNEGVSPEDICLELLQPAARELGQMWVDDTCTFTHVTLGTVTLQSILHDLAADFRRPALAEHNHESVLLTTIPGEQHGFGVSMTAEFLRAEGWDVTCETYASVAELRDVLGDGDFTLFGLSVGHSEHRNGLKSLLSELRQTSRNPGLVISIGGPALYEQPDAATRYGADWSTSDARQLALKARQLVSRS